MPLAKLKVWNELVAYQTRWIACQKQYFQIKSFLDERGSQIDWSGARLAEFTAEEEKGGRLSEKGAE